MEHWKSGGLLMVLVNADAAKALKSNKNYKVFCTYYNKNKITKIQFAVKNKKEIDKLLGE